MGTSPRLFAMAGFAATVLVIGNARSVNGQCEVWQPLPLSGVGGSTNPAAYAVATYNGDLIVGGDFTQAGAVSAANIARLNGSNWLAMNAGLTGGAAPKVLALTVFNGDLIAGGDFTVANNGATTVNRVARWNGSFWQSMGTGMNAPVRSLTVFNNELVAGGDFTTAGGIAASRIARWNGTAWQTLGGLDGPVNWWDPLESTCRHASLSIL